MMQEIKDQLSKLELILVLEYFLLLFHHCAQCSLLLHMKIFLQVRDLIHLHDIFHAVHEGNQAFRYYGNNFFLKIIRKTSELDESHGLVDLRYVLDENRKQPQLVPFILSLTDPLNYLLSLLGCVLHKEALHAVWHEKGYRVHHMLGYLSGSRILTRHAILHR